MKIQRHYTEAKFLELMEAGSLKPFDYLQPCNGTTSAAPILKVYIGTTASHWVCHNPMNRDAFEKLAESFLITACKKSKMPCTFAEFAHSQFVFKNTMLTLQGKLDADEAKAHIKYWKAKAAEKAAEAEDIAGANDDIEAAVADLIKMTLVSHEMRACRSIQDNDADITPHECRLDALKEVRRVLDDLITVTCDGGRPAITDQTRYRQLVEDSFRSGGIVKREIEQQIASAK